MKSLIIGTYRVDTPLYEVLKTLKGELTNGKLKTIQQKGSYISVTCPFHSEGLEKHPSCGIYIGDTDTEYGAFNCFTCGTKGSFVYFVAGCLDTSVEQAKKWLIAHFGVKNMQLNLDLEPIDLKQTVKTDVLDEAYLDTLQSYHPYMDKRKLSRRLCEVFKIKYDPKSECIVFPVWDEQNKLCMLTRRSVKNKNFYIDKDKEKPVYLMNFIREKGIQEVAVCESQINALSLWEWNIPAVATFGCNVTDKQMDIFNKSNLKHIYLCFDGDAAGRKGTKKFLKKINKDIFVDVIEMTDGKDVNDLTEEEFNTLKITEGHEWLKMMIKQLEEMTGPYCSGAIIAILIDCLNELVKDTDKRELRTLELKLNDFFSIKYDFRNRRVVDSSFIPKEIMESQHESKN